MFFCIFILLAFIFINFRFEFNIDLLNLLLFHRCIGLTAILLCIYRVFPLIQPSISNFILIFYNFCKILHIILFLSSKLKQFREYIIAYTKYKITNVDVIYSIISNNYF